MPLPISFADLPPIIPGFEPNITPQLPFPAPLTIPPAIIEPLPLQIPRKPVKHKIVSLYRDLLQGNSIQKKPAPNLTEGFEVITYGTHDLQSTRKTRLRDDRPKRKVQVPFRPIRSNLKHEDQDFIPNKRKMTDEFFGNLPLRRSKRKRKIRYHHS